jgi:hypothetical protein
MIATVAGGVNAGARRVHRVLLEGDRTQKSQSLLFDERVSDLVATYFHRTGERSAEEHQHRF